MALATDEFPTGQLISLESPSMAPVRLTLVVISRPPTTRDVDAIGYTLMIRAEVTHDREEGCQDPVVTRQARG